MFYLLWNLEADSRGYLYFYVLANICPTRSMPALAFVCGKRKQLKQTPCVDLFLAISR